MNSFSHPLFQEPHSRGIRLWHWLLFIVIAASITTVGLATFGFRTASNIPLVQEELQQKGITADEAAARAVSHAFNDKLWTWHTWLGFGIAALILVRILLEWAQPKEEKLRTKFRRVLGFVPASELEGEEKKHYLGVKWTYLVFYMMLLVMAVTGLGLALEEVRFFRSIRGPIKSVHSYTQYLIYGFVLLHLTGVIVADNGRYPGLVSRMINGGRTNKKDAS
jgi:cytochrome b561